MSILAVAGRQLVVLQIAEDRFIAGELVREGLEVVRSMRDSNWLKGVTFNTGLTNNRGVLALGDTVGVDGSRWNFLPAPSSLQFGDVASFIYDDHGVYRQAIVPNTAWGKTSFQRIISFEAVAGQPAVRVIVEVRWGTAKVPPRVIAETLLYDWK